MTSVLWARILLALIGIAVWGYGHATDQSRLRFVGMGILVVVLLMRFIPKRWFEDTPG
jgi:hypothetical protein